MSIPFLPLGPRLSIHPLSNPRPSVKSFAFISFHHCLASILLHLPFAVTLHLSPSRVTLHKPFFVTSFPSCSCRHGHRHSPCTLRIVTPTDSSQSLSFSSRLSLLPQCTPSCVFVPELLSVLHKALYLVPGSRKLFLPNFPLLEEVQTRTNYCNYYNIRNHSRLSLTKRKKGPKAIIAAQY